MTQTRRIVHRAREASVTQPVREQLKAQLVELEALLAQVELLSVEVAQKKQALFEGMKKAKIKEPLITESGTIAEIVTPVGRAENVIDPEGFYKLVGNDKDFFSAVRVYSDKAKSLLSGKELAGITNSTPGQAKPEELSIKKLKPSKK